MRFVVIATLRGGPLRRPRALSGPQQEMAFAQLRQDMSREVRAEFELGVLVENGVTWAEAAAAGDPRVERMIELSRRVG